MSKKSRKRNRLILAALAAGTLAANRKKKGAVSTANQPVGVDRRSTSAPPIGGTDHIPKVVVPKAKAIVDSGPVLNVTGGIHAGKPAKGMLIKQRALNAGNSVPPSMRGGALHAEGYQSPSRNIKGRLGSVNYRKDGGRATYKSGGAAKRGISPILLKGKR